MTTTVSGVHSEVGTLRSALVCRPGLAHERLTPENRRRLLFDDPLDVQEAQSDHDDLVLNLQQHGVEVLELRSLLAETLYTAAGRAFVLDRCITRNEVGPGLAPVLRAWLDEMPAPTLAEHLLGGIGLSDFPKSQRIALMMEAAGGDDVIVPPLPNALFQRDASCWIFGGLTCNPMGQPARRMETLLLRAVYRHHPRFQRDGFTTWWGDSDEQFGAATIDGGDVLVLGKGVVAFGISEHTTRQAVFQIAEELFKHKVAHRVICCVMPNAGADMRLDTVLTFGDRDLCIANKEAADQIRCYSAHPVGDAGGMVVRADEGNVVDVLEDALGLGTLRVITTSGDPLESNVLVHSPGVVVSFDRSEYVNAQLQDAGIRVVTVRSQELSKGRGGCRRLACPISRDAVE